MNPADFADQARNILADSAYQTDFPKAVLPEPPDEPPAWLVELLAKIAEVMERVLDSVPGIDMSGAGDGLRVLLFLLLAGIILAGLFLLIRWLAPMIGHRSSRLPPGAPSESRPPTPARILLASARQAIADGDLDRAAGYLLEAVLAALAEKTGQRQREADTARQILNKIRVETSTLDLLRALVTLRERVHYAGRPPARPELDAMLTRSEAIIDGGAVS